MKNTSNTKTLNIKNFFDKRTSTLTYVVNAHGEKNCIVIDPVTDFDQAAGRVYYESADQVLEYIEQENLIVHWILETHAHADHLSGAPYIQRKTGGKVGIGEHISNVQKLFRSMFNFGEEFKDDGSQFSTLFKDMETFEVGSMKIETIHVPGHTPADIAYLVNDCIFVGDTLFMPDGGSARADFPGGDAKTLYRSAKRILSYPEHYKIYVCHDYQPNKRELKYETTVGEQRKLNIHLGDKVSESEFINMRRERDKTLGAPQLIIPSIQVNIQAGELPPPESNGVSYIKVPINQI